MYQKEKEMKVLHSIGVIQQCERKRCSLGQEKKALIIADDTELEE